MTSVSVDQSGVFTPLAASLASDDVVDVASIENFGALDAFVGRDRVVLRAASCSDGRVFGRIRDHRYNLPLAKQPGHDPQMHRAPQSSLWRQRRRRHRSLTTPPGA